MTQRKAMSYFAIWGAITALVYAVGNMLLLLVAASTEPRLWAFMVYGAVLALVYGIATLLAFVAAGLAVRWASNRYDHTATPILRRNTTIIMIVAGLLFGVTDLLPLPVVIVLAVVNWRWWSARIANKKKKNHQQAE